MEGEEGEAGSGSALLEGKPPPNLTQWSTVV